MQCPPSRTPRISSRGKVTRVSPSNHVDPRERRNASPSLPRPAPTSSQAESQYCISAETGNSSGGKRYRRLPRDAEFASAGGPPFASVNFSPIVAVRRASPIMLSSRGGVIRMPASSSPRMRSFS